MGDVFFEEVSRKLEKPGMGPVSRFQEFLPRMKAMKESGDYRSNPYFNIEVMQRYLAPRKQYEEAHGMPFLLNGWCLKVVEEALGGSPAFPHKGSCFTRVQEVLRYNSTPAKPAEEELPCAVSPEQVSAVIKGMSFEDKAKLRALLDA